MLVRSILILLCWTGILSISLHAEQTTLRVGIFKDVLGDSAPQKDYMLGTTVFMKEFLSDKAIAADIQYYDDPIKLAEDFKNNKLDLITADALSIVRNIPISYLINGVMAYKASKKDSQTLLILGRSDDKRPLEEKLRGEAAINSDAVSELYLRTLLLEQSSSAEPNLVKTKSTHQSLLKLFFGKADIAIVDLAAFNIAAELNPQLKSKFVILKSTSLSIGPVAYMRKGLSAEIQKNVIISAKALETTSKGKQLLRLFRGSNMDESTIDDLSGVIKLNDRYQSLLKHSSKSARKTLR